MGKNILFLALLFAPFASSVASAQSTCPICVPPYCGRSNYSGSCVCVTKSNECDLIGSCDCYSGSGCACTGGGGGGCAPDKCYCGDGTCDGSCCSQTTRNSSTKPKPRALADPSSDVLSAKVTEHPWLQSTSFANDLKSYSPALEWSIHHVQEMFRSNKISAGQCMGKLGGGTATDDGGMIVFDLTRDRQDWTLVVARFNKEQATAFRAKMNTGEIDPRKDFFQSPEATLHIHSRSWTLQQGSVTRNGLIPD